MDESIKVSIDARRSAITNTYELGERQAEFDELFKKIEELGQNSQDAADFEARFAASPLNQEYTNFFAALAMEHAETGLKGVAKASGTSVGELVAEEVMHQTGDRLKQALTPSRAAINQAATDKLRDIPVVGDAMNVKQHLDLFSRFKKSR